VLEYEAMSGRREQLETHYYKGKSALLFRFIHAGRGIRETWRKESNFRIQVLAALVVLPAAVIFPLSAVERAILVLVIALILTLEIVNSIFERLLDIVHPQFSEDVRRVKDSMAGAVFVASAASVVIGALIFAHPLVAFDAVFEQVLSALRTDTVVRGAQIITMVGDWKALGTATAVYSLVLLLRKSYRQLSFLFGSMATGAILLFVLKEFFARARPHGIEFVAASGYSFPSGHVFMATIFFLGAIYVATQENQIRKFLWAIPAAALPLVALTRVVLSAHWFSDIAAGLLFGLFWLLLWYGISEEFFGIPKEG